MKTRATHAAGFTLVEIMIVVGLIGLLAAIAIPNFMKARTRSQQNVCINNLRQIEGAIEQWGLELRKGASATLNEDDVTPYLKQGSNTACPTGGSDFAHSYIVSSLADAPTCMKVTSTHLLPQ